ncbi:unnamed protein product [Paramecium octaurelia]|uniref:Cyclin-like domain-containing protein n=1 Tax=Paramecium octaurelia TaxID=43137 RepID=A0A8S1SQF8_PAROT|nr:unnamed protein product [Paramecium octaurelia]
MELINHFPSRKFGQELTNLYYRPQTRLNLSQLKKKAESTNTSMRHKSQREINSTNVWYQVSIKKRTSSQHSSGDSVTHRQKSSRCSSRNQTIQTVRFCDVKQLLIDEQNKQFIENIDMVYSSKPQYCSVYAYDIQEYLKSIELSYQFSVQQYFHHQPQITQKMRSILIEWIIDVTAKFRLKQETLYLTISLVDRYMLTTPVSKNILQLIGVSALFIASKVEEVHQLMAKDLAYITDKTYTKEQILYTESLILKQLNFNLTTPTIIYFLSRYQNICPLNLKHFFYCQLLIEIYLLLQPQTHSSSQLAAASFWLIRKQKKYNPIWPEELEIISNCNENKLHAIVKVLQSCQSEFQTRQTVFNSLYTKYSQYKYCRIINM